MANTDRPRACNRGCSNAHPRARATKQGRTEYHLLVGPLTIDFLSNRKRQSTQSMMSWFQQCHSCKMKSRHQSDRSDFWIILQMLLLVTYRTSVLSQVIHAISCAPMADGPYKCSIVVLLALLRAVSKTTLTRGHVYYQPELSQGGAPCNLVPAGSYIFSCLHFEVHPARPWLVWLASGVPLTPPPQHAISADSVCAHLGLTSQLKHSQSPIGAAKLAAIIVIHESHWPSAAYLGQGISSWQSVAKQIGAIHKGGPQHCTCIR
jgi:hypothetical protein